MNLLNTKITKRIEEGADQVETIEKAANELKKWAENLSYNLPSATKVGLTPSWRYKEVILLLYEKTNIGAKVEKDFAAIDKLHQKYENWRGKDITEDNEEDFRILVDNLKGALYDLAGTLQQIVKNDREKLAAEKPAETGGNATLAKGWRIKAFFWKLYETTVKAFFDSLLGKSLPK